MISRIKIMAKMDISEKRLPQDGRIKIRTTFDGKKKEIDYRVSSLPTLFGEKIVLRILDRDNLPLDMSKLGFEEASLKRIEEGHTQTLWHGAGYRTRREAGKLQPSIPHSTGSIPPKPTS